MAFTAASLAQDNLVKGWVSSNIRKTFSNAYGDLQSSIETIANTDPKDVQTLVASLLKLFESYHQIALAQSRRSFSWALVGSGIGLAFFGAAVVMAAISGLTLATVIPLMSGTIVELLAGIVFHLYGRTTTQLSSFYSGLEKLQRYILANSLCESLDGPERNTARAELIREISRPATSSTTQENLKTERRPLASRSSSRIKLPSASPPATS
jgi:hypothetical protein